MNKISAIQTLKDTWLRIQLMWYGIWANLILLKTGYKIIEQDHKMDKRIKLKWAEALLSGDYKKGQGSLKKRDCYCVMGVLCDLHRKETGAGRWINLVGFDESYESEDTINHFMVTGGVCNWAKVDNSYFNRKVVRHKKLKGVGEMIAISGLNLIHLNDLAKFQGRFKLGFKQLAYIMYKSY